jgi:hypothetical protein
MSDCCTPGTGFPTGPQMGQLATNFPVIWQEICMLQQAILAASSQCTPGGGQMCVTVGGNTPMTFVSGILEILITNGGTGTIPNYQGILATAAQTVVNTIVNTIPISGNTSYLLVFVNGVMQMEGALLNYTVTGPNQITFVTPLALNDNIAIYSYATGVTFGGGSGYYNDSPSVVFVPPVGVVPSVIATGTVTTNGGSILSINMTNGGLGYQPVPATLAVTSTILGAGAVLAPLVNAAGQIIGVNIINGGLNYTINDTITATRAILPGPYTNAVFKITAVSITGAILSVAVLTTGNGYEDSVTTAKIVSTLNPLIPYPTGSGVQTTVFTDIAGTITSTAVINGGAGYSIIPPYLVITDPGTGAVTLVTLSGTSVASIAVLSSGSGYTQNASGVVFNPSTAALPNPPANPAIVDIVVAENTFGTNPNLYYQVWAGLTTNKPIQQQLNSVLSYFKGLGYTIQIQSNPATGSTIQWKICW